MPEDQQTSSTQADTPAIEALLKQIRDDFSYVREYWRDNHDAAEKDMDCIACIPPADFTKDRAGRPCIWPDETSQYVKQSNNNLRQNQRSIKISPRGEDAKDIDAEHRQAYIRGIEYASKAQSIYSTAFEACTESAFGFWRINCRVVGPNGEQEPRIVRIPNQFCVFPDPDAREADFSDSRLYFVLDSMRDTTFAQRYKHAKKRSFTPADVAEAPQWFNGHNITVAEYWTREESEGKDGVKAYTVTQRITNGLEVLETNKWIGSWIPIVGVFGEEIYVRSGGQSKRMFMSLIRRARPAQQMLAYVASQEAEEFGMAPRAPLQGYKGQFDPQIHKLIHKVPMGYVEYSIPQDWNTNWGPPPLPNRVPFIPNANAYEIAYERWRRAIQAAMGINPLPTAAQRQNEKSGVALERIQTQAAVGSFHFTDNFKRALENTGRQLNELITLLAKLDSLPKQLLGKDQKEQDRMLHVVRQDGQVPASSEQLPEANLFFAHRGQFEVAVSDGPNYQSQREEASEFADTLLSTLPKLGVPPPLMQQIISIAIRLKNIGTYGDEIADLLAPPDPNKLPPAAKAILAQSQGQIQMLTQKIQELELEKLGKATEYQGKMALADKEGQIRMAEADKEQETKMLVAEITTKAQNLNERMAAFEDMMAQWHSQAHELAAQLQAQQHAKELSAQSAEQQQQASQQAAAQQNAGGAPSQSGG